MKQQDQQTGEGDTSRGEAGTPHENGEGHPRKVRGLRVRFKGVGRPPLAASGDER